MIEIPQPYKGYYSRQDSIYAEFNGQPSQIVPAEIFQEPLCQIGVYFRFDSKTSEALAKISQAAGEIIPSLTYGKDTSHTTLTTLALWKDLDAARNEGRPFIEQLSRIVGRLDAELLKQVMIDFTSLGFNKDTVIAMGQPSLAFWKVGEQCVKLWTPFTADANERKPAMPKMGHSSLARPLQLVGGEQIKALSERLGRIKPIGVVYPIALDVATFRIPVGGPIEMDIHTHRAI